MADPERTRQWLAYYNAQPGVRALALSAKQGGAVRRLPERALALDRTCRWAFPLAYAAGLAVLAAFYLA